MKAEDGGLWPRAREPPEPPEPPEVGEARREPSLEPSDGVWPGDTLISDAALKTGRESISVLTKPPSLQWGTKIASCCSCSCYYSKKSSARPKRLNRNLGLTSDSDLCGGQHPLLPQRVEREGAEPRERGSGLMDLGLNCGSVPLEL